MSASEQSNQASQRNHAASRSSPLFIGPADDSYCY